MKSIKSKVYMFLLILFMYVPILTLVVFSFNAKDSRVSWGGFSLRWYERLFSNQTIMMSLLNTVIIAVITSVISTILGTAASIGINNLKKTPRAVVMNITYVPIINPEIITGVSLMLLFKMFISLTPVKFGSFTLIPKLQFGYLTLILAHISFCVPYVIYNVLPKLRQLNPNLVEAAEDLGCSPHQAFFKVVIPEILPGVFSGFIMALTYSLDDFVVSYFNSGSSINTLPITIQSMTKRKIHPDINALSTLIFLVILIILVTKNILDNRRLRKEAEDARLKFSEN